MAKNKVAVNEEIKFEIMGISFLAFSVLCLVSLFSKTTGAVGEFVDMALQRLAGEGKYIFPFIVAFYGFKLIKERRKTKFSHQLLGAAALLAMVLTFIHIQSEEKSLFQAGWEGRGGGIIGGAFSAVFINLFGKTGTYIILITLFIINVILITNISAITLFKRFTANVLAFMQRLKEGIADFIFTEEEEVEVPDQSPVGEPQLPIFANKKKAPIFLDNGVLQYEDGVSGQGREIKFADYADDGDEPQVNIYSEPIEKLTESGSELARIDAIIEKEGKGKQGKC